METGGKESSDEDRALAGILTHVIRSLVAQTVQAQVQFPRCAALLIAEAQGLKLNKSESSTLPRVTRKPGLSCGANETPRRSGEKYASPPRFISKPDIIGGLDPLLKRKLNSHTLNGIFPVFHGSNNYLAQSH